MTPALWMILACAFFALMAVFVKEASAYLSIAALVMWRGVISAVFSGGVLLARGGTPRTRYVNLHFYRGVIGIASLSMFYYAVAHLPIATAVTLNYLSPVILTVLTTLLLRERLKLGHVAAVALSFSGTVLLLRPTFDSHHWLAGLVALTSAFTSAFASYNVRVIVRTGEPEDRVVFWFSVTGILAALPVVLVEGRAPFAAGALWPVIGLGLTGTLGQLAITRAFGRGVTVTVAALSYSTVVFSSLLGMALRGEMLPASSWIAIGVIIAGGVVAIRAGPARGAGAEE